MKKKIIISIILLSIVVSGNCSSQNCKNYKDDVLSIKGCIVKNLIISDKEKRTKIDSVVNVQKNNYSQYKKIGDFEVIYPLDLEKYKRSYIDLIVTIETSTLIKLLELGVFLKEKR